MKQERMCLSTFSRSILFHMVQFSMRPKKPPDIATRGFQVIHAAITSLAVKAFTQFLLSSRLYCRFWNLTKSAAEKQVADCNRRWGIAPRPEELIVDLTIVHLCLKIKRIFSLVFRYWPFKYSITPIWIVHASRSWYSAEFSAAASFQFDKKPHSTITIGCFTCRRR